MVLTLADSLPPDVLNGAAALAVDTLNLVGADDGVLQGATILDDEDGVRVASLLLASAVNTTAKGLVLAVVGTIDLVGLVKGDRAGRVGNGEVGTTEELLCASAGLARSGTGGDGARDGEEGKEGLDEHVERVMNDHRSVLMS